MSSPRPPLPLRAVLDALLEETRPGDRITLDRIGDALGALPASTSDIEEIFVALESAGREIDAGEAGGKGEERLKVVVATARVLRAELGRSATQAEIAARSSLTVEEVRLALALARVMQR